jgi:hypothetical protein
MSSSTTTGSSLHHSHIHHQPQGQHSSQHPLVAAETTVSPLADDAALAICS